MGMGLWAMDYGTLGMITGNDIAFGGWALVSFGFLYHMLYCMLLPPDIIFTCTCIFIFICIFILYLYLYFVFVLTCCICTYIYYTNSANLISRKMIATVQAGRTLKASPSTDVNRINI
jgi:hypothetical protein